VGGAEQYQVIPNGHDDPRTRVPSRKAVAIVTGGSSETGREVARALAGWGWAIVVVYLEHQPTVEATVAEILATDGKIVAVRADLADDLDVERLPPVPTRRAARPPARRDHQRGGR
jgi:NADP-dependent 3-hydroxy acid dehydrogenase YdfG